MHRAGEETGLDELSVKPHERLADWLAEDMAAVNVLIRARMTSEHAPRIPEVTAHLVEAGGKRLRPMLTLAAARLCGYDGPFHVHLAATVEFIHTATLLHDDVVDESERRRGRPTANLLWDNKSSVLVGDYLFARSFQLMVETGSLRVLDILANASAVIAEGEVLQLTDDLLDYGGSSAAIGKNTGDDFRERKVTLPVIKAVAKADAAERAFWVRVIETGRQDEGDLARALAIMARHGAMDAARADALAWAAKARAALQVLPDHPLRSMLDDLADYVVARVS